MNLMHYKIAGWITEFHNVGKFGLDYYHLHYMSVHVSNIAFTYSRP